MINLLILPFSLIGFFVSWHIYDRKHRKKRKLVCIIGSDCDKVIHSKYSKMLGIHLEVLGLIYYFGLSLLVILSHLGLVNMFGLTVLNIILIFTTLAFAFSIFLVSIQAFTIKDWCEYCLISALMSTIIFLIEIL